MLQQNCSIDLCVNHVIYWHLGKVSNRIMICCFRWPARCYTCWSELWVKSTKCL